MASVGSPATESGPGVGRVATAAEVAAGVTGANGPAFVTPERLPKQKSSPLESALIGSPFFLTSTTLPAGFMWADGSLALFADWPELYAKYAANGFAGMLLSYSASSYDKSNYPAMWVPNAASPSGLYLPRLGGLFPRHWTPGQGTAGARREDTGRNVTGQTVWRDAAGGMAAWASENTSGAFYTTNYGGQFPARINSSGSGPFILAFDASRSWGGSHTGSEFAPVHVYQPTAIYLGVHA